MMQTIDGKGSVGATFEDGIVGCGWFGPAHARSLGSFTPSVRLIGPADTHLWWSQELGAGSGADAISTGLPHHLRREVPFAADAICDGALGRTLIGSVIRSRDLTGDPEGKSVRRDHRGKSAVTLHIECVGSTDGGD